MEALTKKELALWRQDQTTKRVLQYLKDYAAEARRQATQALFEIADDKELDQPQLRREIIRIQTIADVLDVQAADFNQFYNLETPMEE